MKKKWLLPVAALILAAGIVGVLLSFHIVDGQFYAKNAETLDLRGKSISTNHYDALAERMPDCRILWDVPCQDGTYASDSEILRSTAPAQDPELLKYFPELKTLDAGECDDLSWMPTVREQYPNIQILAKISLDGTVYDHDTKGIQLSAITEAELEQLPYLTELKQVTLTEGGNTANFADLQAYCQDNGIACQVVLNGETLTEADKTLTLADATNEQVQLLMRMPWLEEVHLQEPTADAELVIALRDTLTETKVTWEKTVMGQRFGQDVTEIDLSGIIGLAEGEEPGTKTAYEYSLECYVMGFREEEPSTAAVTKTHPFPDKAEQTEQLIAEAEASLAYFPEVTELRMCGAWLENEAMSQFRERHREDYKVVWSVMVGKIAPDTDTTFFMPTKYGNHMGGFNDFYTYNLRYCEDIVSMDIGHMLVADIEFVEYMPKLKYLVLYDQPVSDLTPLIACKELVYLELYSCEFISDYSPLLECRSLEDLNISDNDCDITPVLDMTWLKNLWMVHYDEESYRMACEALPDTTVGYRYGNADDGWRMLPNYFNLRDELYMFYLP